MPEKKDGALRCYTYTRLLYYIVLYIYTILVSQNKSMHTNYELLWIFVYLCVGLFTMCIFEFFVFVLQCLYRILV